MALVTLACIILLPVLPAYLLFKALPSKASLRGPLQGLGIKLSGAFSGYFAVVVLVINTAHVWNPPEPYQVWKVSGRVVDAAGAAIEPLDIKDVEVTPPEFHANEAGGFELQFSTIPAPGGGVMYPDLIVTHPDFGAEQIHLDPAKLKAKGAQIDYLTRQIDLDVMTLKRLPTYSAAGLPPPPASK